MENFKDVFNEVKEAASKSKKVTFSRTDFDRLTKAYLNDVNYKASTYGKDSNGEAKTTDIGSVVLLRGMIKRVLKDFGVDEQEAAKIMTDEYQFRNVDGVYELCSELIYQYLNAGKKFSFMPKEDFEGSLVLNEVEGSTKIKKGVGDSTAEFEVVEKPHKKLKAKSSCPKWLKTSTRK